MADTPSVEAGNPFEDPAGSGSGRSLLEDVLAVDRNATLTLGIDSLILLDEGLRHRREAANCCGLLPQLSKTTKAIPFYNVLWAELGAETGLDLTIHYARKTGKRSCGVGCISYDISDKSMHAHAKQWVSTLMEKAYPPNTKRRKRIKVLVNPFGGKRSAPKIWTQEVEPFFAAAKCKVEVERTAYQGHAAEIAQKMDVDAFDVVACASGDGLPHEVFNGLARRNDAKRALRKIAVTQIPCGSGNAMSLNLNGTDSPSLAALAMVKGIRTPLDLMAITQGSNKYYSFLSQGVGIVAETDVGTESLRWMGDLRFTWGILVRLLSKAAYPAELSILLESDDKHAIKRTFRQTVQDHETARSKKLQEEHDQEEDLLDSQDNELPSLRYGTVQDALPAEFQTQDLPTLGNFYVGNMCFIASETAFFPTALPSDGLADMICISAETSRATGLRMLTAVADGTHIDYPQVSYRKIRAYRITPRLPPPPRKRLRAKFGRWLGGSGKQKDGLIAIDGERVPFEPFQAEVVPALGTTLSRRRRIYESDGLVREPL